MSLEETQPGLRRRLLRGLVATMALAGALASALLAGLEGSPVAYAMGGVAGPGIVAAVVAGALALTLAVRARRRSRHWITPGAAILLAAGCTIIHGCSFDRSFVIEPLIVPTTDSSIAGDLYLPETGGPFPAVVIVPGSAGSQPVTRDSLFGVYRAAAEKFAEAGIAAFVYDRRGSGESPGDRRSALLTDHAADVVAIRHRLGAHDEIEPQSVGIWGISAGAWVAGLAAREEPFAFLVLVSAPTQSEGSQRLHEWSQRLRRDGVDSRDVGALVDLRRRIWEYLASGAQFEEVKADYEAARAERWWRHLDRVIFPRWVESPDSATNMDSDERRWFLTDMARDPLDVLDEVNAPVLAIYGGRDEVIPMPQARQAMQDYSERPATSVAVRVYARANHGLVELAFPPRFPDGYWSETIEWIRHQLDQ